MKEAILVDVDGLYKEPVLVDDSESGVSEIYETPEPTEAVPEPEPVVTGYRIAVQVPEGLYLPKWDSLAVAWVEGKVFDPAQVLADAKASKLAELDTLCNQTILAGFDYTISGISYHFYLPITAQSNFIGADSQFKAGKITSVRWTVLNNSTGTFERIDLDWATFGPIADMGYNLVDANIRKLRDTLEPQISAAATLDEVHAIVW
jgi:hypothetical protein